jgi:hypothetical protein
LVVSKSPSFGQVKLSAILEPQYTPITKFILTSLAAISVFSIISCTKTNNVKTTVYDTTTVVIRDTVYQKFAKNPIVGLWVGTYKQLGGNAADSFYYSFTINSNGTMVTTSIGPTGSSGATAGSWQLAGTNFMATVTQLDAGSPVFVQSLTAVYDSTAGTLNGQGVVTQGSGTTETYLLFRVPQ